MSSKATRLTAFDIETMLSELGIDHAGPSINPVCFSRHRLAAELFSKLNDRCQLWNHPTDPSNGDDVIIGNG